MTASQISTGSTTWPHGGIVESTVDNSIPVFDTGCTIGRNIAPENLSLFFGTSTSPSDSDSSGIHTYSANVNINNIDWRAMLGILHDNDGVDHLWLPKENKVKIIEKSAVFPDRIKEECVNQQMIRGERIYCDHCRRPAIQPTCQE